MTALLAIGIATAGAFALEPRGENSSSARNAQQELLDLMHAWAKAILRSDVGTMDRLLAYEMIGTDPTGCLCDKSKYLEHVRTNAFHVESCELKETKIQVYGDAAVITGLALSNVNSKRPSYVVQRGYIVERVTRTWIRRQGTWQCVAFQTMVVIAGEHEDGAQHPASAPHPQSAPQGDPTLSPTLVHPGQGSVIWMVGDVNQVSWLTPCET
jgi:hypothetical protein